MSVSYPKWRGEDWYNTQIPRTPSAAAWARAAEKRRAICEPERSVIATGAQLDQLGDLVGLARDGATDSDYRQRILARVQDQEAPEPPHVPYLREMAAAGIRPKINRY